MSSQPVLIDILNTVQSAPLESLVIFDLDSTLFDLRLRVTSILRDFAADAKWQEQFPAECRALGGVEIRPGDWGIETPLMRLGLNPARQSEFFRAVKRHWSDGFFSNHYLRHDFPLPGAVEFVHLLHRRGGQILYLTGRDVRRMQEGTLESLRETGFPLAPGDAGIDAKVRLHLKPHAALDDAEFKALEVETLASRYPRIWLFENEPVNINAVLRRTPAVQVVFVDTCHSGIETLGPDIPVIADFL